MNMVWMVNDGHVMPGDDCDKNFLTFVLQLRKNPGKISARTVDRTHARWIRGIDVTSRPQRWSLDFLSIKITVCHIAG